MAGTTPNYSWPYPESSDFVADGATAIENLADAIDTTVETFGTYTDHSASQTSSGLTVGNGTWSVVYTRINDLVHYKGKFTFGSTSAITAAVDLVPPVSLSGGVFEFNSVTGYYDSDANVFYYGSTIGLFGNFRLTRYLISGTNVTASDLSSAAPFTWAVNDFFTWNVTYKAT